MSGSSPAEDGQYLFSRAHLQLQQILLQHNNLPPIFNCAFN